MATSQFGAVLAALHGASETALTAEDVLVTYGAPVSDDPGDFLMLGVDDPTSPSPAIGSWEQVMGPMATTRPRDETGTINCAAASHNGDNDLQVAFEQAMEYIAAVETLLRADPSLGLTGLRSVVVQIGSAGTPMLLQDDFGVSALVVFTVTYDLRI